MDIRNPSVVTRCPACLNRGVNISCRTVKALANLDKADEQTVKAPRLCRTRTCPVVYFDEETSTVIEESRLSIPVWLKHPEDHSLPVCYCFDYTGRQIRDSLETEGSRSVSVQIAKRVREGACECEVRNPKGTCCLGDVVSIERKHDPSPTREQEGGSSVKKTDVCIC